jgi:hypothetical protein
MSVMMHIIYGSALNEARLNWELSDQRQGPAIETFFTTRIYSKAEQADGCLASCLAKHL